MCEQSDDCQIIPRNNYSENKKRDPLLERITFQKYRRKELFPFVCHIISATFICLRTIPKPIDSSYSY